MDKVEDLVPRFGFNTNTRARDKVRFASEPAPDVEVDTNFIDDFLAIRFSFEVNAPRADIIKLDEASNIFLKATIRSRRQ